MHTVVAVVVAAVVAVVGFAVLQLLLVGIVVISVVVVEVVVVVVVVVVVLVVVVAVVVNFTCPSCSWLCPRPLHSSSALSGIVSGPQSGVATPFHSCRVHDVRLSLLYIKEGGSMTCGSLSHTTPGGP